MGSGGHLLVVGAEPQDEQRLRKAVRNERSVHPRGDDTSDGEALSSLMRLFGQFLYESVQKAWGCGSRHQQMRLSQEIGYRGAHNTRTQPGGVMTYLRCTIGRWNTDLSSDEGQEAFRLINDEGLRVFRSQPGFVRYRLMLADPTTTIAVAEWESRSLASPARS